MAVVLLAACGITGGTRKFKLSYSTEVWNECQNDINLVELSVAPSAGINQAIGAYNFGKFGEADRINVEESLSSTLEQLNHGTREVIKIRVFLHRYAMSFSNNEVAILAIVDWSATQNESVVHDEVFYVTHYARNKFLVPAGTLGSIKDKANKAIVRYIADKAFSFSCEYEKVHLRESIHYTPSSALAALPGNVGSNEMFIDGVYVTGSNSPTFFSKVIKFDKIDWKNR